MIRDNGFEDVLYPLHAGETLLRRRQNGQLEGITETYADAAVVHHQVQIKVTSGSI